MNEKIPCIYIMASQRNGTLYTGVTSDLKRRIEEHKSNKQDGFTKRYNIHTLVYYKVFEKMMDAIEREKQIKAGSRKKKLDLIEKNNPDWNDLTDQI
jgi:putative endonuclease